jgi:peptide/nickel transport system permease protein
MKLRTYLLKRTIHMIITILIVLVLLFVLYRMMPGSAAASMMMNPKMTQTEIDMVMVRYGFGRWTDYPGDYTVTNLDPQTIGRYTVTVEAIDDAGQTDSFLTQFDVNAAPETDYVAPRVLDVGLSSASIGQKAVFYLRAYDIGTIKTVDVTITCPNQVVVGDDLLPFTETFRMSPVDNMTDVANKIFYFSGTTTSILSSGQNGNTDFSVTFAVQDRSRNIGSAALAFNATTGLETNKIWDLSVNIPYSNQIYTYPTVNQAVALTSKIMTGTPSFSMVTPNMGSTSITSMAGPDVLGSYNGTFTLTSNGILTYVTKVGDLSTNFSFAVNSVSSMPAPVNDDDSASPILSGLTISLVNRRGQEVASPDYPFILKDIRLRVNATALDSAGVRCSNVTAFILKPDGSTSSMELLHPTYVKMRTMAEQFVTYMKTMLLFDFGTSYIYQRPAWDVILERVPSTALLFGSALVVSDIIGILVGVVVAWRRGTALEMGTIIVTLFFYSMPIFWFALIMQWVFYAQLGWFPLAGMGGIDPTSGLQLQGLSYFLDVMWHLTMPLITLVILGLAGTILLMRTAMLEVMGEDFTTTAKAKGLKERQVVFRHVARNAMLPVVTSMAMSIGGIISGGVLTETIFSWYGMGTLLIEGTLSKDFPVVQGAFYILALLTIFGNMAADILYAWLDPRVQL